MQKFVSSYQSHVISKINKLMAMYELWTINYLSTIEPLAKAELTKASFHLEAKIDPRFDKLLNTFSKGKEKNEVLRSSINFIHHKLDGLVTNSISHMGWALTKDIKRAQKVLGEFPEEKPSIYINKFSEKMRDLRDFYTSLSRL